MVRHYRHKRVCSSHQQRLRQRSTVRGRTQERQLQVRRLPIREMVRCLKQDRVCRPHEQRLRQRRRLRVHASHTRVHVPLVPIFLAGVLAGVRRRRYCLCFRYVVGRSTYNGRAAANKTAATTPPYNHLVPSLTQRHMRSDCSCMCFCVSRCSLFAYSSFLPRITLLHTRVYAQCSSVQVAVCSGTARACHIASGCALWRLASHYCPGGRGCRPRRARQACAATWRFRCCR